MINAAAYTEVDAAETAEGRREAWAVNVDRGRRPGRRRPASTAAPWCTSPPTTSSTARPRPIAEDEPFSPLGVYGQTKAAGDALVADAARGTTSCAPAG